MKMNHIRSIHQSLVAAVALWGAATVLADDKEAKEGHHGDKEVSFIKEAAKGGKAEVQVGKMASEKAHNSQVKEFAQHLVKDHSKANQELMQIAQKHGVTLPTDLTEKAEHAADKLEDKTGAEFDKAFIQHSIKKHQKDIKAYQTALEECQDTQLRAFIKNNLPALREHLQMAMNIGKSVGVDQSVLSSADQFLNQGQSSRSEGLGTAPGSESGQGGTTRQPDREQRSESPSTDQPDK